MVARARNLLVLLLATLSIALALVLSYLIPLWVTGFTSAQKDYNPVSVGLLIIISWILIATGTYWSIHQSSKLWVGETPRGEHDG